MRKIRTRFRFNSRLREEATVDQLDELSHDGGFNSRLREEATGWYQAIVLDAIGFNSRLREEATAAK